MLVLGDYGQAERAARAHTTSLGIMSLRGVAGSGARFKHKAGLISNNIWLGLDSPSSGRAGMGRGRRIRLPASFSVPIVALILTCGLQLAA